MDEFIRGFRTLVGLELVAFSAAACHAGETVSAKLRFAPSRRSRPNIRLKWAGVESSFAIEAGTAADTTTRLPCARRGWMHPGRLKLWTDQPLGLFVIWSWLNPKVAILVYPAAEPSPPPFPLTDHKQGKRLVAGDGDEYAGLREYRNGDPQRQIAWKASARHDSLLVRESERESSDELCFDLAALVGLDLEAGISRLTAWIVAADAARLSYTVALPGTRIGPGIGEPHRHACLRALALLPDAT